MNGHPRTLEEIRGTLEDMAREFAETRLRTTDKAEALRLGYVIESIEVARLRVLDVSVEVAQYITYCLDRSR